MSGPRSLIDIRVERPGSWEWIDSLRNLVEIDLMPPASGPEIELTFTVRGHETEELREQKNKLCQIVRDHTGRAVLAARVRFEP